MAGLLVAMRYGVQALAAIVRQRRARAIAQEAAQSGASSRHRAARRAPRVRGTRSAPARQACAERLCMDLKLKPFDFAQAVARAGLRPDGMPLARGAERGRRRELPAGA